MQMCEWTIQIEKTTKAAKYKKTETLFLEVYWNKMSI